MLTCSLYYSFNLWLRFSLLSQLFFSFQLVLKLRSFIFSLFYCFSHTLETFFHSSYSSILISKFVFSAPHLISLLLQLFSQSFYLRFNIFICLKFIFDFVRLFFSQLGDFSLKFKYFFLLISQCFFRFLKLL